MITNNSLSASSDFGFYDTAYEKDPEFIKQHIAELNFAPNYYPTELLDFLYSEPKLAEPFFTRNFDKILSSDNGNYLLQSFNITSIELSRKQEFEIAELFGSRNNQKRKLASHFITKMEDTQLLRDAYSKLIRKNKKAQFVTILLNNSSNEEVSGLARELHNAPH